MTSCAFDNPGGKEKKRNTRLSDEEKFDAWCEWRKWCSVLRVLEPYSYDERRENNWIDEKAGIRYKYYNYLLKKITRKAYYLAQAWHGDDFSVFRQPVSFDKDDIDDAEEECSENKPVSTETGKAKDDIPTDLCNKKIKGYGDEPETDQCLLDPRIPFITFFDEWMKRKMKKPDENGIRRIYKDYIFNKVEQGIEKGDPALKIIYGKVVGSKSYLIDLLKDYLEFEFSAEERKNRRVTLVESLSKPVGNTIEEDGMTLEDTIESAPTTCLSSFESPEIYRKLFAEIKNDPEGERNQRAEKIVLFANAHGVRRYNSTLNEILGHKKEYASNRLNDVFQRLQLLIEYDEAEKSVLHGINELIFEEFRKKAEKGQEKEAFEYLCMLKERDSNGITDSLNVSTESMKGIEK